MRTITTPLLASALSGGRRLALIDVTPEDEHARGRIPRSMNIPARSEDFAQRVAGSLPDRDLPVVVYCSGPKCNASSRAARRLAEAGFGQVYDYPGGFEEWRKTGNPVASSVPVCAS